MVSLRHDGAMLPTGIGIEMNRGTHVRKVNGKRIPPMRSCTTVHATSDRYDYGQK